MRANDMTETPQSPKGPDKKKQFIDDTVREMYKEAKTQGLPFGLIFSLPESYGAGVTTKFTTPGNKTEKNYDAVITNLFCGVLDVLVQYVPAKELKQQIDELYKKYELDNYQLFLNPEDGPPEDPTKPFQ